MQEALIALWQTGAIPPTREVLLSTPAVGDLDGDGDLDAFIAAALAAKVQGGPAEPVEDLD